VTKNKKPRRTQDNIVPNDSLGAVHLNTVSSDFAQRLYFNVAAPMRSSNAATVPERHRVTLTHMKSAATPLQDGCASYSYKTFEMRLKSKEQDEGVALFERPERVVNEMHILGLVSLKMVGSHLPSCHTTIPYATAPFLQCIIVTFEHVPGEACGPTTRSPWPSAAVKQCKSSDNTHTTNPLTCNDRARKRQEPSGSTCFNSKPSLVILAIIHAISCR
jgi:hypothetical protein